ncbi:MAG: Flp pilus assembly complex ATPase component TadA [Candidatus Kaiserbacteria bacterium]|nr:Flp pilus assembly complex ATPase component TadA [Candidatus Kaiserbacteria bacterium]MCB9816832.1 Flp pilus assembly complex ATPase component TadA [Candidatus Nomurabacteria bacterium]
MDPLQALQERGGVDQSFITEAERIIGETGRSYESVFEELGMSKEDVRQFMADFYQVPVFDIPEGFTVTQEILDFISEESAQHYRMVPLKVEDDVLVVGVNNPDNLQMREALNFISTKNNIPYKLVYMPDEDIVRILNFYSNLEGDVGDALETLESELDKEIAASLEESDVQTKESLEHIEEDAPVTKIVATILRYAVDGSASDIHIEPSPVEVAVRFRVDGELAKSLTLPKNVHMAVVARVKILSSMRLDERRRPQDGRFSATFDDRKIDFRVSVLPTNHGEKVVMRILDTSKGVRSLEESGISASNMELLRKIVQEPYGIILISGPTGSGKSTTLRGMIQEVDTVTKNVMSLEDPVEYDMSGVSQSQVRPEIGYTFARGLRAALRQDPDIIMVGEIRDTETAQLAIQAALTGHLVLSTIHTNNAIGVIPRLIDMGIDPYLIAPTLKLTIAQRLARTLCDGTGREEEVSPSTEARISETFKTLPQKYHKRIPESRTMLHPEPTPGCATGYSGRTAITEVLEINEEMQELILKNASEEEFFMAARKNGFITIQEDAMIKALNHEIPYEEMNVFSTKIGIETDPNETYDTVDNLNDIEVAEAIMGSDEVTSH